MSDLDLYPPDPPPALDCDDWPSDSPCCEQWPVDLGCCCDILDPTHPDWTPQRQQLQDSALAWAEAFIDARTRGVYRRCRQRTVVCLPDCPPSTCHDCERIDQVELPWWLVDRVEAIFDSEGTDITSLVPWVLDKPNILSSIGEAFPDRTLTVQALVGAAPTAELLAAVGELACQRLRQCLGLSCDLAFDASKIGRIRRGPGGRRDIVATGVPLVDMFLMDFATWNTAGWGDPVLARARW